MMKHGQQPSFKSLFLGIVRPARDAHFCTVKKQLFLPLNNSHMKKIFTLALLLAAFHAAGAQNHGTMNFAGKAAFYVTSGNGAKMAKQP